MASPAAEGIWFPFTHTQDTRDFPPVVIEKGDGAYVVDSDGKRYLDAIASWWVNTLGHCNPRIAEAVAAQVHKLEHVLMAGFVSPPTIKLTALLREFLPNGLTRVFYSDDGSTAVEVALKIAIQYWNAHDEPRCEFVSLGGAYHGDTLGAMSVGMIPAYHQLFHERFRSQHYTTPPYCYRCALSKDPESCGAECMDSLDGILSERGHAIAACVFEPLVQGAAGMRIYPVKVLKRIFESCRRHGVLTIADEVATGFGRTGRMFACDHGPFVPDIMCLAKGITGGFLPMGVTAVGDSIYSAFCGDFRAGRELNHGHSFTGNPLASAAACEALTIMKEQGLPDTIADKMAYFGGSVQRLSEVECVGEVRALGMIGAVELVKNRKDRSVFSADQRIPFRIARDALQRGLLIRPLGNVIYFIPPYVVTEEDIDFMVETTKRSIESVVQG